MIGREQLRTLLHDFLLHNVEERAVVEVKDAAFGQQEVLAHGTLWHRTRIGNADILRRRGLEDRRVIESLLQPVEFGEERIEVLLLLVAIILGALNFLSDLVQVHELHLLLLVAEVDGLEFFG